MLFKQEPRNAAIPLDLDDDTASVQSQETDKQPDTPSSISKTSTIDSKESTPVPSDEKSTREADTTVICKEDGIDKDASLENQEKKVQFDMLENLTLTYFCSF